MRNTITRRAFLMRGATALLGGALVACTPTATPQPARPAATAAIAPTAVATRPPATPAPVQGKGPTLTLWIDKEFAAAVDEISKPFAQEYGVAVVVQSMGLSQVHEQILMAAPLGQGPDIFEAPHDWVGELVRAGILAPLDQDLGGKAKSMDSAAIRAFSWEGKLYGLGQVTENAGLFRNTTLVSGAPKTWDDFERACKELDGKGIQHKLLLEPTPYLFHAILTSFGGYLFGLNGDGTYNASDVGIDSPGGIAAARWLDSMAKKGFVKPDLTFDACRTLFSDGQGGMIITGPWNIATFKKAKVQYAVSAIPAGTNPAKPFTGVRGLMVNRFSKQLMLAQTYLTKFWTSDTPMRLYQESTGKASAWLPVRERIADVDLLGLAEAGEYAEPMPAHPAMTRYWPAGTDAITLILTQKADPAAAFKTLAEQMREAVKEMKTE